jgi:hypothetical protein
VTKVPKVDEEGATGPTARRIITSVWAVGLVHDKVIDELTGVAMTAVTGPGGAEDLAGLNDGKTLGALSAVGSGATDAVGWGDTCALGWGDTCSAGSGETDAADRGDTGAEGDAEAVPAWNTTEVKIAARPIIQTVRTTTKRFIKTRFQSLSNPARAT